MKKVINAVFIVFLLYLICINIAYAVRVNTNPALLLAVLPVLLGAFFLRRARNVNRRHYYIFVAAAVVLGLTLRLITINAIKSFPISDYETMYNAAQQVALGDYSAFSEGTYFHRFPHMTVYTVVLGFLFRLFGASEITVKYANVFMQTVSVFICAMVGRELLGNKGGIAAGFLYALFPADIFYALVAATENFAMPFLLLSFYFMVRAYNRINKKEVVKQAVYAGLALSIGTLLRGVWAFYLAAYLVGILVLFAKEARLLSAIALLAAFLAVFQAASLTLYHTGAARYKLSDAAVPYSVYVLVGSNLETKGMYAAEDHGVYFEFGGDKEKINEAVIERIEQRYNNPAKVLSHFMSKTNILWTNGGFDSVYWGYENNGVQGAKPDLYLYYSLCAVYFIILLALSLIGVVMAWKKDFITLCALLPLAFEAGLMLMEIQPRYTFSTAYIFIFTALAGIFAHKYRRN